MPTATRHSPPWPILILTYTLLHLLLALLHLLSHIRSHHPHPTARASLQLLSGLSLLPALHASRPRPTPIPRLPVLAAFLVPLVILIAALVRTLSALEALIYPPNPLPLSRIALHPLPFLQLLLALVAVLLFRAASPVRALRSVTPWPLRLAVAKPRPRSKRAPARHAPDALCAPAILAVLLHALCALVSRVADVGVAVCRMPAYVAPMADAVAALCGAAAAAPLLMLALRVLLQATPARVAAAVRARCERLVLVEGVVRCPNVHVWEESMGVFVGTVCVMVKGEEEARSVLKKAVEVFEGVVHDLTVQVEVWRPEEVGEGGGGRGVAV